MTDSQAETSETGSRSGGFRPHLEYFGAARGAVPSESPSGFGQRFRQFSEGIYPQGAIQRIHTDGYNPTIFGYSHANVAEEVAAITRRIGEMKQASNRPLVALQEIDPQQLQWIKDFLGAEAEFNTSGTIGGKTPRPDEKQRLEAYRGKLRSNNAEHLSLWYLDNGIDVKSIEHPDVKKWIQEDRAKGIFGGDEEETFGGYGREDIQPFYTAIRRDIHGIEAIEQVRPDIISVGAMHALKYDMLLDRNGENSYYYINRPLEWGTILKHWEDTHARYKTASPRA